MFENLSLYETVALSAKRFPRNLAVYYQRKKIKFPAFVKRIDRMADILTNVLGVKEKDVIIVAQPNIPDTLVLIYALNKIGAVVNLVHPFTPFNQIKSIMSKTKTKLAFVFEQRVAKEVDKYREIADKVIVTRVEDDLPLGKKIVYHCFMNNQIRKKLGKFRSYFNGFTYLHTFKPTGKGSPTISNKNDDVSVLLHSGSTTGEPKTICLSNRNFNFIADRCEEFVGTTQADLKAKGMLSVLPSFHGFGFCMTMHSPLAIGLASVLIPKYSASAVCDALNHGSVGLMCGVPTMYENMLNNEKFRKNKHIKDLYVAWCGGDYLPSQTQDSFNELMKKNGSKCQLFEGYGLTEAIAVNVINNFKYNKKGALGHAIPDVQVKIMDENGNEVKRGDIGEIAIKGGANMVCYFDNPEATKEAVKDGWVFTGDLGYMDEDDFIFFKQRKKRVIKVSGVGVFPSEIENLVSHIPHVQACCAVEIPDSRLQHAVKLFVVADFFDEEGMKETIKDTCRKYLIRWAVPKEIEFINELPKTLLGKIDFKVLQARENERRGL